MTESTDKNLQFLSRFRASMFENQIMLSYKGEISQNIMLGLLELTERKLDSSNEDQGIKSKIFNVMVGCLQNITYHSEDNKHAKSSMFLIGRIEDGYAIYSGNAINNDKVSDFKEKLMSMTDMSGTELSLFYKTWLTSGEMSDKNGIHLGLIDIARRTGNTLDFDFENIDADYSYFSLRTEIKSTL